MLYWLTTSLLLVRSTVARPQDLGGASAAGCDRKVLQGGERIEAVLRRLHHDRIRHTVRVVQPERGRDLAGTREVHHHAVRHVALGDAEQLRARAVDIDVESRVAVRLRDPRVDHARNIANLAQQTIRVGVVGGQVIAANLQVDRRRRAEVQDLTDDVRRWE